MYEKIKSNQIKHNYGFTLVELSIVLVIIGLLVGGVLQGQELIEASKRQSVISDITKYQTAINTFKLQYNGALPGDFNEAEDYWGSVSGNCLTDAGTGTQTCNGDGDGIVDYVSTLVDNFTHEPWRAWEHLSNSEIVSGEYLGTSIGSCNSANHCMVAGQNTPESAYDGAGWFITSLKASNDWSGKAESRNILAFGNPKNDSYGNWNTVSLTTQQQKSIDDKIDDGMPFTGAITDMSGTPSTHWSPNCTTSSSNGHASSDAKYDLSYEGPACIMFVDLD